MVFLPALFSSHPNKSQCVIKYIIGSMSSNDMKIACITQYNDLMFNLLDNKYQIYKLSANVCMLIVVCSALCVCGGG